MTVSPFDHPLLSALLGDEETARAFSVDCRDRRDDRRSSARWPRRRPRRASSSSAAADAIVAALASFRARHGKRCGPAWRATASCVPELVRADARGGRRAARRRSAFRRDQPGRHRHRRWCCALKPIVERFERQLAELIGALRRDWTTRFGGKALTGVHAHAGGDPDPAPPTASQRGGSRSSGIAQRLRGAAPRLLRRAVRRRGRHAGKARRQGAGRAQGGSPRGSGSPTRRNGTASATASPNSPAGCRWSPAASASSARTWR